MHAPQFLLRWREASLSARRCSRVKALPFPAAPQGPRGSYTVSLPARAGSDLLHGRGAWSRRAPGAGAAASQPAAGAGSQGAGGPRLMLRLPSSMDEEDAAAAAAAEAERERARKRAEARAAADGLEAERDDLVGAPAVDLNRSRGRRAGVRVLRHARAWKA